VGQIIVFLRAGVEVDWTSEKSCFDSLLRELAFFYIPSPIPTASSSSSTTTTTTDEEDNSATAQKWQIKHVLFPALKLYLQPPSKLSQGGAVTQLCSLENLYKVFERVSKDIYKIAHILSHSPLTLSDY
jgi:DNA mismatch repair protein MLH1